MANELPIHTHIIQTDSPVTISVTQLESPWFRLYRAVVRSGLWRTVSGSSRLLLVVLADLVNDEIRKDRGDWIAWPSIATLCESTGLTDRSIQRAVKELERFGVLSVRSGGGRKTNTFEMLPPTKWKLGGVRPVGYALPAPAPAIPRHGRHPTPDTHVVPPPTRVSPNRDTGKVNNLKNNSKGIFDFTPERRAAAVPVDIEAAAALITLGVSPVATVLRIASRHPRSRVLMVAQKAQSRPADKRAGFAIRALDQNWNFERSDTKKEASDKLNAAWNALAEGERLEALEALRVRYAGGYASGHEVPPNVAALKRIDEVLDGAATPSAKMIQEAMAQRMK